MKNTILTKSIVACMVSGVLAANAADINHMTKVELEKEQAIEQLEVRTTGLIIQLKSGLLPQNLSTKAAQATLTRLTDSMSATLGQEIKHKRPMALAGYHVFKLSEKLAEKQVASTIKALQADPNILTVEEDIMLQPMFTPNDPRYFDQWHYYESTGGLNVENAWDKATGAGTVVAVLDTGIRNHSDLNANLLPGYDMISSTFTANDGNGRDSDPSDPGDWINQNECGYTHSAQGSSWHGTHVAGTVAAVTNNNNGLAGVAFDAQVVPVRVLGKCGGSMSDINDGIVWASGGYVAGAPTNNNPADVINMSLGGGSACGSSTQAAINAAYANGSVIVVAAGNSSANAGGFTPASCDNVVTVAATDRTGGDAFYTNYGSVIDVAAPGGGQNYANDPNGILSTYNSGTYGPAGENYAYSQGTSMAAPHVAGVAALIKEVKPNATPGEIESILVNTTRNFPASCYQCGSGIVDADAAVVMAQGGNGGGGGGNGTGQVVTHNNQSASRRNWVRHSIDIPAGFSEAKFEIYGGSGDADLYVRYGQSASTSRYDCRPYLTGNQESCVFNNPAAGTYHYDVRAYSSFSGLTITASYE